MICDKKERKLKSIRSFLKGDERMITAENITIKRGVCSVVNDVSWEIGKNERWILFGLNGCGKTTLLRALAGYLGLNKGRIILENGYLTQETKTDWRMQCGFVSASFFNQCYITEPIIEIVLSGLRGHLGIGKWVNATAGFTGHDEKSHIVS